MKIKGIVKYIGSTKVVSDKFKSRELVITVADDKYTQHISLQCTQGKVAMMDNLALGTEVECSINIRGKEWISPQGEVKHFNTIECWNLEVLTFKSDDLPFI